MNAHPYLPHTEDDVARMLKRCGASSVNDLFDDIPDELRLKSEYGIGQGMNEIQIRRHFDDLARENRQLACFAGAGFYDCYAPAVALDMMRRSEFLTSYTPYQAEISQGTLQYIFEYQSMMSSLTGLDVSNASMYDGATATAEAMMMCVAAARRKNRVLVAESLNPATRAVVDTYARYHRVDLTTIPSKDGVTDFSTLDEMLAKGDVAGVIVASPNFHGLLEDLDGVADKVHAAKALLVINAPAALLASIKSPGEWGADIAVGEAQSLGMPLNYGGPYLGYMCTTRQLMRKMPGRIVGATFDTAGKRTFVLTLQAREQHIRREKATSNICSNQGAMTLYAAIYLSLVGADGLIDLNNARYDMAHDLAEKIVAGGKAHLKYPDAQFFNEFVVTLDGVSMDELFERALARDILPGVQVGDNELMIAVTEKRTDDEINNFVQCFND
jgi:glycine dehydrogenase subunit 1